MQEESLRVKTHTHTHRQAMHVCLLSDTQIKLKLLTAQEHFFLHIFLIIFTDQITSYFKV